MRHYTERQPSYGKLATYSALSYRHAGWGVSISRYLKSKEKFMTYFIWLLRLVHILCGAFWFGGNLMMMFFVVPTVREMGEAGPKFVGHLVLKLKITTIMSIAAGLTALAGISLYWIDSSGLTSAWMKSGAGTGFGIGAVFGIIGFVYGLMVGRTTNAMVNLGGQVQGKPSPEQAAQLGLLQKRQGNYSKISAGALTLSLVFMSIARYFIF